MKRKNLYFCLIFFFYLFFIFSLRYLPFQDLPDWCLQGKIFNEFIKGNHLKDYKITKIPVPNSISTFILGILNLIFDYTLSIKIFIAFYLIIYFLSVIYFTKKT